MVTYCPRSRVPRLIPIKALGAFFLFFLIFLIPVLARAQAGLPASGAGLFDSCGVDLGTCGTGLSCVASECLGGNGYITDDPSGCSPELTWKDNRCVIDVTSHGERLGLGETTRDIRDNIRVFLNVLLGFLGVIAVIMIMYAGFLWLTSFGNEERVAKAKKTILWGIVGIFVIGSSWTIASYVLSLGQKGAGVIATPGGGRGGDVGIPSPGGVAEQFALEDVETGRPHPVEEQDTDPNTNLPNENVYLCSAIQARFNHAVNAESFVASKSALLVKKGPLITVQDPGPIDNEEVWKTVSGVDSWTQTNQYITFNHSGTNFIGETQYAVVYPRALTDTGNPPFPLANCNKALFGCGAVEENRVIWYFGTGIESDSEEPDINPSGTYPKAYAKDDPSYPSRGVSARPTIVIAFNEPILASSVVETKEVTYTIVGDDGNPKEVTETRVVPHAQVFELGAVPTANIGTDVKENKLFTTTEIGSGVITNDHWIARFEDYGYGSRLTLQLGPEEKNLAPNGWYQIKIAGVKDLCGNVFNDERHFYFQVSGAVPRLDPTPPDNLTKVCYQNIEVGVNSNISLYDVVKDSCSVGPISGTNGFVTEGKLLPISGRTLKVMDDLPANPGERKLITNYDQYCRKYRFYPESEPLESGEERGVKYQGEVKTRFPVVVDDKDTLLNAEWSFTTAGRNERCVYPPILDRVSPSSGAKGQCISVTGSHINYFSTDEVRTHTTKAKEIIELQKVNDDKSATTCANISAYIDKNPSVRWKDAEVLTKTQKGDTAELPQECPAPGGVDGKPFRIVEHIIDGENGLDFFSTAVDFTLTNGAVGPCLEKIEPDHDVFRGEKITLIGSDFGAYQKDKGSVVYFNNKPDTIFSEITWKDKEITSIIPSPANTGDVHVVNAGGARSNGKTLALPALVPVKEFLRPICAPYLSPNPKVNQGKVVTEAEKSVCVLGAGSAAYVPVYLELYSDFDVTDITGESEFAKDKYYHISVCDTFDATSGCTAGAIQNLTTRRVIPDSSQPRIVHSAVEFQIKNPEFDKVYRITIDPIIDDKGIATPADFKGYSWQFKTMATAEESCKEVKSVTVFLDPPAVQVFDPSEAQATAENFQCQSFATAEFSWNADQPYLKKLDGSWVQEQNGTSVAQLPTPPSNASRIVIKSLNSLYSEAKAYLYATVLKIDGVDLDIFKQKTNILPAEFLVRNSAYCESNKDCANNCPGVSENAIICDQTTNQCNPYVKSVSPTSAGASEWITVQGCYFGESPGDKGKVSFIQGETTKIGGLSIEIPECSINKTWNDTQIIVIVPKGLENKGAQVEITTAAERASNIFNGFTVTDKNTRPMLCAVQNTATGECNEKDCGGVNEEIILYGQGLYLGADGTRFAAFKNTSKNFILESPANPDNGISDNKANTSVPMGAENGSHELRYRVSDSDSNPLQFTVNDEGRATVVKIFPEPNIKECGKDGVACDVPQDLSGMGFVEFDKEIFCDSSILTDCIVVLQNENPVPGLGYAVEVGGRGFLFNTFSGTARLQVRGSYTARLNQSKIKTNSKNKKPVSCGFIPIVDEKEGICEWSFTITEQIIPTKIIISPKTGEDGVIILTPNDPLQDIDARETFVAKVEDEKGGDITNLVPISWTYAGHDALKEVSSSSSELILEAIQNPDYKLGTFQITAKAGDATSAPFPLKIVNDATLKISDYYPGPESACINGVIGVTFNKSVDPKTVVANNTSQVDAVQLWGDSSSSSCFVNPPLNIARSWLRRLGGRVLSWLRITKARGEVVDPSFKSCNAETEIVFNDSRNPTSVNIAPKNRALILAPLKTYEVRVYGSGASAAQQYAVASDGNRLFATSEDGCGGLAGLLPGSDTNGNYCSFVFKSKGDNDEHSGICAVDKVAIKHSQMSSPPAAADLFIYSQGVKEILTAQAYSGDSPVNPISGYMWDFVNWREEGESDILVLGDDADIGWSVEKNDAGVAAQPFDANGIAISLDKNGIPSSPIGKIREGEVMIRVDISFDSVNNQIKTTLPKSSLQPLSIKVRPCEGGGDMFWKFIDGFGNFEFSYCQKPTQSSTVLPRLRKDPTEVGSESSRNVLKEYFLLYQGSGEDINFDENAATDRILLRVFPAANYFVSTNGRLPIENWFSENEETLFEAKSPASRHEPVDGYDALSTVSAVYVHALNVDLENPEVKGDRDKIYSNVYVIAVTEGASQKTKDIMEQLVASWKFNINVNPAKIAALKNDYKRIRSLSLLSDKLAQYKSSVGSAPLILESRIPGVAVSTWDNAWRVKSGDASVHLGAALEQELRTAIALPFDPLDKRAKLETESQRMLDDCLNKTPENLHDCLWGTASNAPMACLDNVDNPDGDANGKFEINDLKTLGLGYDKVSKNEIKPDALELFTCYDNEADESKGKYYCRGASPRVYQYARDASGSFTLYGNLEYTELAPAWCGGADQRACIGWTGGEASFCEWIDKIGCRVPTVTQPECSKALPQQLGSKQTQPFNIRFRPL